MAKTIKPSTGSGSSGGKSSGTSKPNTGTTSSGGQRSTKQGSQPVKK